MDYATEAEACRREALHYLGKPEAPFLLRVARAFDQLECRGYHRLVTPTNRHDPASGKRT